jgi:hypothetical protein
MLGADSRFPGLLVRDVLVLERLDLGVGRRPVDDRLAVDDDGACSHGVAPQTVKWPVNPGNVVVLLMVSIGPVPSQVMSTVTDRPPRVTIVPVNARLLQRR